jgi:hypothetical protein
VALNATIPPWHCRAIVSESNAKTTSRLLSLDFSARPRIQRAGQHPSVRDRFERFDSVDPH